MEKYFINPGNIKIPLKVFDYLLKKYYPKISLKMENNNFDSIIYATNWFITLFTNNLPFKLVTRIIDIFLYEGKEIIYKVALAIMKCKEKLILKVNDIFI
jgi:hypothetical protein